MEKRLLAKIALTALVCAFGAEVQAHEEGAEVLLAVAGCGNQRATDSTYNQYGTSNDAYNAANRGYGSYSSTPSYGTDTGAMTNRNANAGVDANANANANRGYGSWSSTNPNYGDASAVNRSSGTTGTMNPGYASSPYNTSNPNYNSSNPNNGSANYNSSDYNNPNR